MAWNSQQWLADFKRARSYEKKRRLRCQVYNDTIASVRNGAYLSESGNAVRLETKCSAKAPINLSETISQERRPHFPQMEVEVWNEDTLLAAKRLQEEGYTVAALNMANRQTPGGGVARGAGAQEENLFRRSNLFAALYPFKPELAKSYGLPLPGPGSFHYPMDQNYGGIYAKDVTVFRGTEDEGYPLLDEPFLTDIISVAAINRPELDHKGRMTPPMVEGTKNKIRSILRLGMQNGRDALVLGAFGCGAFQNPPAQMAEIFDEVLHEDEFSHSFRKIVFAILDDHNAHRGHNPAGNFQPFADHFNNPTEAKPQFAKDDDPWFEISEDKVYVNDANYAAALIKRNPHTGKYGIFLPTWGFGHPEFDQLFGNEWYDRVLSFNSHDGIAFIAVLSDKKWQLWVAAPHIEPAPGAQIFELPKSEAILDDLLPVTLKFHLAQYCQKHGVLPSQL
ncbi:MAG: TIGR02452 family protein [Bacteroidales bacterium]|nr:TIGR02452 family protein [Bacteroidales bacterium]